MSRKKSNLTEQEIEMTEYFNKHELALRLLYSERAEADEDLDTKDKHAFMAHCLYFYHNAQDVIEIYETQKIPEMVNRFKPLDFNEN